MSTTVWLEKEIKSQPEILEGLLRQGYTAAEAVTERIRKYDPAFMVIAARGSSDNAARYAQYLFGIHNRIAVALATPSTITHYGAAPRWSKAVVLGVSQSGQSPDIVAVISEARRQGALTLAVVNDTSSELAQKAELCMPIFAGREKSIAATKSYTNQLAALAMLSSALNHDPQRLHALNDLPALISQCIDQQADMASALEEYASKQHIVVIGRGYNYATAFEIALKIKEVSYIMSEAYSTADFLHGPVAMLDDRLVVMAVAPAAFDFVEMQSLIQYAKKQHAKIIAISDNTKIAVMADTVLAVPAGIPEWLSPLVMVVPGQIAALELAKMRGMHPDKPRNLSKITKTW